MEKSDFMEKISSLAKRRGFIFPSSEIYGGFSSSYDYGPLGAELKNNIKRLWWKGMVERREDIYGLDSAILMNPKIWKASGHLSSGFADVLVECKKCHHRFKAKKGEGIDKCLDCGSEVTKPRMFNLMMKTFVGSAESEADTAYFRPETAQGIYVNFENVRDTMRPKVPFGIAQIGKAFRNEITPGHLSFRMREFEQMEMQYFIKPGENKKWFDYWCDQRMEWYHCLGLQKKNLYFYDQKKDELAHYAKQARDVYYKFPFGDDEIEGIHNRGDWDLSNHEKHSGKELKYFNEKAKEKFLPNIIETSAGADRLALTLIIDAYTEEEVKGAKRIMLKFNKKVAPIKIAIFPLARNKENLVKLAHEVFDGLKNDFMTMYDDTGSIGKLYRRQDEIGTPYCITVDFDSLDDKSVTVRDRDTMKQERVKIAELKEYFSKLFTS